MPQFAKGFRGLLEKILYLPSFWFFKYTLLVFTHYLSPPFCSTWCIIVSALGAHTIHTYCQSFCGMLSISLETELGPLYFQGDLFPSTVKPLAIEIQNSSKTSQYSLFYSVSIQRQHLCVWFVQERFITFLGQLPCQLYKHKHAHTDTQRGKEKWASFMSELNNFKSANILQSLMKRNF